MELYVKINDFYSVSNIGNVKRNSSGKVLKPDLNKGYHRVTLSVNNIQERFLVHRLVAFFFIPNPYNKKYVNHKDGNKTNNKVNNLEWVTASENELHSVNVLGKKSKCRKLNEKAVLDIRENAEKFNNIDDYALKYNVSRETILNVINKKFYV